MILARVFDHRLGTASKPSTVEPLDQALSRVHEMAAVAWDRDCVSLDDHDELEIVVGLWDRDQIHDGSHGCVVVVSNGMARRQVVFDGHLRWLNDGDRPPPGNFYRDLYRDMRNHRITGDE